MFLPIDESVSTTGPIEDDAKEVRTEPFTLPEKFYWDEINVQNDSEVSSRPSGVCSQGTGGQTRRKEQVE